MRIVQSLDGVALFLGSLYTRSAVFILLGSSKLYCILAIGQYLIKAAIYSDNLGATVSEVGRSLDVLYLGIYINFH